MADDKGSGFERMTTFLNKLRELLKGKVDAADFDESVRQARAHAGGKARAQGRKDAAAADGLQASEWDAPVTIGNFGPRLEKADTRVNYREATEVGATCSDCRFYMYGECRLVEGSIERAGTCNLFAERQQVYVEGHGRLFVQTSAFAEPPEWMPFLPKPGTYTHPTMGEIDLPAERNKRFVDNFKAGIYQEKLPVDAEHEYKLSGAVGWITDMRVNEDGSVDAAVEWTERGVSLIEADAYKYVSPEWWEEWTQPETGDVFSDVPIGAALTVRPFFKERSLRPLVANEQGLSVWDGEPSNSASQEETMAEQTQGAPGATTPAAGTPPAATTPPAAAAGTTPSVQATEPTQLAELNRQLSEERAARTAAETRIASLERESRVRAFTDEVLGRSDANNLRWAGEPDKHVSMLVKLSELTGGPESEDVKSYVETQRGIAQQMHTAGLFSEVGSAGRSASSTALGEVQAKAAELRKTKPELSEAGAIDAVISDPSNAALARRYREER